MALPAPPEPVPEFDPASVLVAPTDVLLRLDAAATVLYASRAARSVLGYGPDELVGRPLAELIYGSDRVLVEDVLRAMADPEAEPALVACRCQRRDGALGWVELYGQALVDPLTQLVREWRVVLRDVTSRTATERELREQCVLTDALFEHSGVGLSLVRPVVDPASGAVTDFTVLRRNQYMRRISPLQNQFEPPYNALELLPTLRESVFFRQLAAVARSGKPWQGEYQLAPGSAQWFYAIISPLPGGQLSVACLDVSRQKRLEHALRDRERELTLAAQVAGVGLVTRDLQTGEARGSDLFRALMGLPAEPDFFTRDALLGAVVPDDRPGLEAHARAALTDPPDAEPRQFQCRIRRFDDGQERVLVTRTLVRRADDGQPAQLVSALVDITEAKRARQLAAERKQQLRLAAEVAGLGLVTRNLQTEEMWCSDRYRALLGLAPDEPLDRHAALRHVPAEDRARLREHNKAVIRPGAGPRQLQFRVRPEGGSERTLLLNSLAEFDAEQRPVRLIAAVLDVTEAQQARQTMAEREAQLSLAAETAGLGLLSRSGRTDQLTCSPTFLRLLGLPPAPPQLDRAMLASAILPDDRARVLAYFEQAGREATHAGQLQFRIQRFDTGAVRTLLASSRALPDTSGRVRRVFTVALDVTDLQLANERAQQLSLVAEVAGVGLLSHDLRTDYVRASASFRRLLGLPTTDAEIVSRETLLQHIVPADRRPMEEFARAVNQPHGWVRQAHFRIRRADDGRERTLLISSQAQFEGDEPVRMLSAVLDVTEVLQASQWAQQLSLVAETVGLGLATRDLRTNQLVFTPTALRLVGFPPEPTTLTLPEVLMAVVPADRQRVREHAALSLQPGVQARQVQFRVQPPEGPLRTLVLNSRTEADAGGRPIRSHMVLLDVTDLHQAAQRADEREQELRLAAEVSEMGMATLDLGNHRFHCSPEFLRMLGRPLDTPVLEREEVLSHLLPPDRVLLLHLAATAVEQSDPDSHRLQVRIRRADSQLRTLLVSFRVQLVDDQPRRIILAHFDVTDLEQARQQAAVRAQQLLLAARLMGFGEGTRDLQTDTIRCSPALLRLLGLPPADEAVTYPTSLVMDLVLPEDRDLLRPTFLEPTVGDAGGRQVRFRIRRTFDGQVRTLVLSSAVEPDAHGRPRYLHGIVLDLTEAQQAAEEREEMRHWQYLMNGVPEILWLANADGRTTLVNTRWYDYTGQTPEDVRRNEWMRAVHPDDLEPTGASWFRAVTERVPLWEASFRLRRHDGQYRWHVSRAAPLENNGWVGSATDVHERVLALESLRRANQDLDTFIYAAAHDLKAPIDNLDGLLQAIRDECTFQQPAMAHALEPLFGHADQAVGRFRATLADLAQVLALAEDGAPEPPADVAALLAEVEADLGVAFAVAEGYLCLDLQLPTLPLRSRHLRSLLHNLVSNALKYRHPDRPARLWLRTNRAPDGRQCLTLTDNGRGFTAQQAGRAFQLFGRLHPGAAAGTGVGLFLVRRIAEQAGGEVRVDSTPDKGTTFMVLLPPAPEEAPEPA